MAVMVKEQICSVPICDRFGMSVASGNILCAAHHRRWSRGQSLDQSIKLKRQSNCSKCTTKNPRTLEFFPKRSNMNDGLSSWCKACHLIYCKQNYKKNPEKYIQNSKKWAQANPNRRAEIMSKWKNLNPERYKILNHTHSNKRRIRELNAKGFCTSDQLKARIDYYKGICYICKIAPWEHVDHVIPLSKGGTNWPSNLRPACAPCNLKKNAKLVY